VSVGHTLSLLIDGAIVHAQMGRPIDEVVENFKESVDAIVAR